MYDLVVNVNELVESNIIDDNDTDTCDTETDNEYNIRMKFLIEEFAEDVIADMSYNNVCMALTEWFDEDVLMRINHATLVFDILGVDILNIEDAYERDCLILKACLVDDYYNEFPKYVKYT